MNGLIKVLPRIIDDIQPDILCFQEVNCHNIDEIHNVLSKNGYKRLSLFPMKTRASEQYNLMYFNQQGIELLEEKCVARGDVEYQSLDKQRIKYGMSDYRTSLIGLFKKGNKQFLVGSTHTDYISPEGEIRGTIKTINKMDEMTSEMNISKILVGDFNMAVHMSEMFVIRQNINTDWSTVSILEDEMENYQSWHGYNTKEKVNPDFAIIDARTTEARRTLLDVIHQVEIDGEKIFPSDHHPVLFEIQE